MIQRLEIVKNGKINLGKNLLLASIFTAEETEECLTMVKNDAKKIRKHEGEEKPYYEKRETSLTMSLKYNKAKLQNKQAQITETQHYNN